MHTIAVIGLGYVGLPLSLRFAEIGDRVIGLDVDETKIKTLQAGHTYIKRLGTDRISATVKQGTFIPSANMSRVAEAEAVILCVPTPLTKQREPDLSYVLNTGRAIAAHLERGTLVVLESTTYPGTTDEDLRVVLEQGSGMKAGADFHLASSPEREDPGNAESNVGKVPKIVGGFTAMPDYVVQRLIEALNARRKPINGSKVLLLGLAYKANVGTTRESPTFVLLDKLRALGAEPSYYDPHVPVIGPTREHADWPGVRSIDWNESTLRSFDVAVVVTAHASVNYEQLASWCDCIVDSRNVFQLEQGRGAGSQKVWKA